MPELLKHASSKNTDLVERVRRHHPHARKLWDQSVQAQEGGAVGPAMPASEWLQACCKDPSIVFCRKFPVVQLKWDDDRLDFRSDEGESDLPNPTPTPEVRPCNDTSASPAGCSYNFAWAPAERIVCSDSEVFLAHNLPSASLQ